MSDSPALDAETRRRVIPGHAQARVEELRAAAQKLGLSQHVDFCLGLGNQELRGLLGDAVGGLHTMLDEHFGISVVEYMAAGAPGPGGVGGTGSGFRV